MPTCGPQDFGRFLGCTLPADAELIADGWEQRYIADTRMAKEAVETYGELGYEVRLEPVITKGLRDECAGCKAALAQFRTVYTRKQKS